MLTIFYTRLLRGVLSLFSVPIQNNESLRCPSGLPTPTPIQATLFSKRPDAINTHTHTRSHTFIYTNVYIYTSICLAVDYSPPLSLWISRPPLSLCTYMNNDNIILYYMSIPTIPYDAQTLSASIQLANECPAIFYNIV